MSYQVLARKWRPQNFKQMVGQEHVLKALIHALESQRLHHAYLFTGTRGVGKTTIGRILAKCLSCDKGITAEPCGTCGACQSIVEGRYVDLIEIDAASRTKVEDMRELLDNVQYAPAEGRFKIYLIDEVHMLSQSSFNALLKTLEEPPEHVKFLFATTDPQKLPVTVLSRCLQFNLKNMSPERIVGHLQYVLNEEQVQFEDRALWALARAADGSMRDALSLTDQAIAYGNRSLNEVDVSAMLGTVDQKKIYRILDRLVNRDAAKMLNEVASLAEFSPDYKSVLATLSEVLHRVAVEQAVPGACDNSMGDKEQVVHYARQICAEDVQLFYQIALVSRQDLSITPDPKSGLEMALLRMMAFQLSPVQSVEIPPLNAESEVVEHAFEEDESKKKTALIDTAEKQKPLVVIEKEPAERAIEEKFNGEAVESLEVIESPNETTALKETKGVETETAENKETETEESWNTQVTQLGLSGMTLNLLLNAVLEITDGNLQVYFDAGHFRLLNRNHDKRIREALLVFFGQSKQLDFVEGLKKDHETPMMWRARKHSEKQAEAKKIIQSDPYVNKMLEQFDGVLIEDSIQAIALK